MTHSERTGRPPINVYALASVTVGALGLVLGRMFLGPPLVISALAIFLGTVGLRELKNSAGSEWGYWVALTGIGSGCLGFLQALWYLLR